MLQECFQTGCFVCAPCQSAGKPDGDPSLDGPGPRVVFLARWPALRSGRPRYVSSPPSCWRWTQVLRKIPPRRLSGPTGSCRLCDLAWCLVSQKAFFLGSRGCAQPGPVITGRQGGLRSASRGARTDRVGPRVLPRRQGAGGCRAEVHSIPDHGLHLNFSLAPDGDIPWSCSVGFV